MNRHRPRPSARGDELWYPRRLLRVRTPTQYRKALQANFEIFLSEMCTGKFPKLQCLRAIGLSLFTVTLRSERFYLVRAALDAYGRLPSLRVTAGGGLELVDQLGVRKFRPRRSRLTDLLGQAHAVLRRRGGSRLNNWRHFDRCGQQVGHAGAQLPPRRARHGDGRSLSRDR